MTATRFVWEAAGSPTITIPNVAALLTETPGTCAICATHVPTTADANKALGNSFTDRTHIRHPSDRICEACLWCCSGKPPASIRMWSIIAAPQAILPPSSEKAWLQTPGLFLHNRASARTFGEFLTQPPEGEWVMSIAISAQKHVLPYATINNGSQAWTVRVEDRNLTSTPTEWQHLRAHALALRAMGIPQEAVHTGQPAFIKTRNQLDTWMHHNNAIKRWLNSPLLDFALWTITKEQIQ